jgi:hypothetical protein
LEADGVGGVLQAAVHSVRSRVAMKGHKNAKYSLIVKTGYDEILKLREEGYSYNVICEVFAENGLLPNGANPKTFCSAFLREMKRREKRQKIGAPQNPDTEKTVSVASVKTDKAIKKVAQEMEAPEEAAVEKEWIRKLDGIEVDTGRGKITKHSDGSFDF